MVDPASEAIYADRPKRLLLEQGPGRADARDVGLPVRITRPEHGPPFPRQLDRSPCAVQCARQPGESAKRCANARPNANQIAPAVRDIFQKIVRIADDEVNAHHCRDHGQAAPIERPVAVQKDELAPKDPKISQKPRTGRSRTAIVYRHCERRRPATIPAERSSANSRERSTARSRRRAFAGSWGRPFATGFGARHKDSQFEPNRHSHCRNPRRSAGREWQAPEAPQRRWAEPTKKPKMRLSWSAQSHSSTRNNSTQPARRFARRSRTTRHEQQRNQVERKQPSLPG